MNNDTNSESQILLDALVSYADACTLPTLTPTCPFYEERDGKPTCDEQCRDIAQARGAEPRRIRAKNLGGLVMLGREIPVRSIAGREDFDAAELRLRHEHDEPYQQPTASLLVGLRDTISTGAYKGATNTGEGLAYWGELERREFPIEHVMAGGISDSIATIIALSVATPILFAKELTPFGRAAGALEDTSNPHREAWTAALRAANESARNQPSSRLHGFKPSARSVRSMLGPLVARDISDERFAEALAEEPLLAFATAPETLRRISAWLAHLFETDIEAALATSAPEHASTFAAFPLRPRDEVAKWLSDRFLLTDLNHWSPTSLTLEWRYLSGFRDTDCPTRVLAERALDRSIVGEQALASLGDKQPRRIPPQALSPDLFVQPATAALNSKHWDTAVGIFEGLTRMIPTDHDAWNNLGFCQLATNPQEALSSLEHAMSLRHGDTVVSAANRALALHLLHRDDEALVVADQHIDAVESAHHTAVMWKHPSEEVNTLLDDVEPVAYLQQLRAHILGKDCEQYPVNAN
ncbi:tetratricopeptide repeat protein [Curtobacterium sp. JUb34]|uniref:tetratricopeptide repeat protein n=1 Tax=Curtobacterium sp. JUb34 TaxID=2485109 RepID=UPI0011CE8AD0|nr:hypothetical protein [Curtobacterium sp. JUb34]